MRNLIMLVFVSVFFSGCTRYLVNVTRDDFEQTVNYQLAPNVFGQELGGFGSPLSETGLGLGAQKFVAKDGSATYSLIVYYRNEPRNWLYISSGDSLKLLIDGQLLSFNSQDGSANNRSWDKVSVQEYAWYDCTLDDLKKIAFAKSVKVKVIGQSSYAEAYLVQQNFDDFKKFLEQYAGVRAGGTENVPGIPSPAVASPAHDSIYASLGSAIPLNDRFFVQYFDTGFQGAFGYGFGITRDFSIITDIRFNNFPPASMIFPDSYNFISFLANAKLDFGDPDKPVVFYGTGGGGPAFQMMDFPGERYFNFQTDFSLKFGLGTDIRLNPKLALTMEADYVTNFSLQDVIAGIPLDYGMFSTGLRFDQ